MNFYITNIKEKEGKRGKEGKENEDIVMNKFSNKDLVLTPENNIENNENCFTLNEHHEKSISKGGAKTEKTEKTELGIGLINVISGRSKDKDDSYKETVEKLEDDANLLNEQVSFQI